MIRLVASTGIIRSRGQVCALLWFSPFPGAARGRKREISDHFTAVLQANTLLPPLQRVVAYSAHIRACLVLRIWGMYNRVMKKSFLLHRHHEMGQKPLTSSCDHSLSLSPYEAADLCLR